MKLKLHFFPFKIAILTGFLLLFNQCSKNPVSGKKQVMLMSESQEKALGADSNPQILAEFGEYPDPNFQRYINDIGQRMAKISHRPTLPFQFKVVDSDVVNAFALPGGYVYFTRGIMAHFNSEAQLAGVLGHEIGHVTARHGASQYTKQMLGQVAFIGAMIASPKLAQFGEQLGQGLQLLFLKFSRDDESQSDQLGVLYSSKIGFNAQEMAGFFITLNRLSGGEDGSQRIPTFLSTHPDPGDRSKKVQAMALDYQAKNPGNFLDNRDSYLRLIDGIIYGEDPKQGYVENNIFYHPELKFQFPIPTGWKHINSPAQFQMASPDQKALMILTLAPEKTLSEAANNFVTKNKLKPISQQNTQINGLSAIVQVADQVAEQQQQAQQAQTVRIATTYIEYNGMIYMMHGVSEVNDFRTYDNTFGNTMKNFRVLTDPSKINVKPERVKIQTTYSEATLGELLKGYGTPEKRLKELSILNGMELTQRVARGTLIKTIGK